MDYESKYKEALERAKYYYDRDNIQFLEDIFPELAESEGEKIRKAILTGLIDCRDAPDLGWSDFGGIVIDDCIDWLEKQGEHKPTDNSIDVFIKKAWDYISRHQLEYNDYDDFKSHMKGE